MEIIYLFDANLYFELMLYLCLINCKNGNYYFHCYLKVLQDNVIKQVALNKVRAYRVCLA